MRNIDIDTVLSYYIGALGRVCHANKRASKGNSVIVRRASTVSITISQPLCERDQMAGVAAMLSRARRADDEEQSHGKLNQFHMRSTVHCWESANLTVGSTLVKCTGQVLFRK
jgi:hypothetical protein